MNKVNFFAITGAAGTIASYLADANEILRSIAAIASIIASCSAILLARANLKRAEREQIQSANVANHLSPGQRPGKTPTQNPSPDRAI
jgi:hypothetical protein